MRELQHRQKIKHRIYSTPALAALAILTAIFVRGAYNVMQKELASAADLQTLKTQEVSLENQEAQLNQNMASLQTDAGIDEEIKEKFSVVAPGEHVAVIIAPAPAATSSATTTPPWYIRLWDSL